MLKDAEGTKKQTERSFTAAFALLVTALACSIVVVLAPRPVHPSQLPALRLPRAAVEAELAVGHALADSVRPLEREPEVVHVLAMYREEGLAELAGALDMARLANRRRELSGAGNTLFARLGAERTRALMASITERAMSAWAEARDDDEARGLLGSFPALLVRYGYVASSPVASAVASVDTPRGFREAPLLAVRTLYKARFNLIFERALDRDLRPMELLAYEGFNALHAAGLPAERRARAAQTFYRVGGHDGAEAAAIWMYQGGAHQAALALLRREYARTGALRLRNMALYAARGE
ncbi:MAG: hypothetical protein RLZZ450_1822 [Pseudomonadota bacterium]|jgi:hypothetical protein